MWKKKFGFSFDLSNVIDANNDLIEEELKKNNSLINNYFKRGQLKKWWIKEENQNTFRQNL